MREELEAKAAEAICSCMYYDFMDARDSLTDGELQKIIDVPFYSHCIMQTEDPVDAKEFAEEIISCYFTNHAGVAPSKEFAELLAMELNKHK